MTAKEPCKHCETLRLAFLILLALLLAFLFATHVVHDVWGQELPDPNFHPKGTPQGAFYRTWVAPDNPNLKCCGEYDCYPTRIIQQNGKWVFMNRETRKWQEIPDQKMEWNRDTPDGQSHVCHPKFDTNTVWCAIVGTGS